MNDQYRVLGRILRVEITVSKHATDNMLSVRVYNYREPASHEDLRYNKEVLAKNHWHWQEDFFFTANKIKLNEGHLCVYVG